MTTGANSDAPPVDDGACFACGTGNPHSLGWTFAREGSDGAHGTVTLDARLQGYRGVAHGGVVMMLLDEVMAYASGYAGAKVMTASASVRFRAAVPLETPLDVRARVIARRGKIFKVEAAVRDAAGGVLATAEGSFVYVGPIEPGRFGNPAAPQTV